MKNLFFTTAVVVLTMLSFTSCEDMIVSSNQTIDLVPKASITGVVTAELNLQNAGAEFVPEGTQLFVEVNYADINPGSVGKWMDTISVAADGKYSVSVPTDADGVTVTITPIAFDADQTQTFGSLVSKVNKTYSTIAPTVKFISAGQAMIANITYDNLTAAPNYVDKVRITGKFTANLDQEKGGYENVPDGTVISFYSASWKDSAVVANGKYSISVPKGAPLSVKSKFNYSKKVWDLTTNTYRNVNYEYKCDFVHTFDTMDEVFDILAANLGEGTDLTIYPIFSVVTGSATAELDESLIGQEDIPNGTIIKLWTNEAPIWGVNVSVTGGQYTVNAPKGQLVYWSTKFNAVKKVAMIDPQTFSTVYVNEDYEYSMNGSNTFTADNENYSIAVENGSSVNPKFSISGSALVELDDTNTGLENIPNGTSIKVYYPNSNGTTYNATVSNGKYILNNVPKGRNVTLSGTFSASKKANGSTTVKTFTITGSFTADGSKIVNLIAITN